MISQASSRSIRLQASICENITLSSYFAFEQTSLRQFVSLCMYFVNHFGLVLICDITWRLMQIFELTFFVNRRLAAGISCSSTQRTIYISDGYKYSPFLGLNHSLCKNSEVHRFSVVTTWLCRCSWAAACLQGISELLFRWDGDRFSDAALSDAPELLFLMLLSCCMFARHFWAALSLRWWYSFWCCSFWCSWAALSDAPELLFRWDGDRLCRVFVSCSFWCSWSVACLQGISELLFPELWSVNAQSLCPTVNNEWKKWIKNKRISCLSTFRDVACLGVLSKTVKYKWYYSRPLQGQLTVTGQLVWPESSGKPREKIKRPEEAGQPNGCRTPYCEALGLYKALYSDSGI